MPALPLPAYRIAAFRPWFEQLPVCAKRITVAAVAATVVLVLILTIARWYHHSRPAYVLEVLDRVNSPADVQAESEYLTAQSKDVLLWLQKKAGDKPSDGTKVIYSAPVVDGDVCDVPLRVGKVTGTLRLLKVDHWRWNDVYFDKMGDKSIEPWASYMKDHLVRAWWSIHGGEMFDAFCKGALIGASLAR